MQDSTARDECSFPVFIPSKGRYDQRTATWHMLLADSIPFTIVVEPQDEEPYTAKMTELAAAAAATQATAPKWNVAVLPASNQGVSYVRNFILDNLAPPRGLFWIIDDDVSKFCVYRNCARTPLRASEMFDLVWLRVSRHPKVPLFSLEYENFGYKYNDDDVKFNSYNNIAVLMDQSKLPLDDQGKPLRYRGRLREDFDFTLQIILHGGCTLRFKNLCFSAPSMSKCAGGMTPYYRTQKAAIRQENAVFVERWIAVAQEKVKGCESQGTLRYDIRVTWPRLDFTKTGADPAALLRSREPLGSPSSPTAPRQRKPKSGAKRKRRGGSSEDDFESTGSSETDAADLVEVSHSTTVPRKPVVRQPREPVQPGWAGWGNVEYRSVAAHFGTVMGFEDVTAKTNVGDEVVGIPWDMNLPSLVQGTVMEAEQLPANEDGVMKTRFLLFPSRQVYGRKSGMPNIFCNYVYAVPESIHDAEAAVDTVFDMAADDGEGAQFTSATAN